MHNTNHRYHVVDASGPEMPSVCFSSNSVARAMAYAHGSKFPTYKGVVTEEDDDGNVVDRPIPPDPFCMLVLDREAPDLLLCSITS